MKALTKSEPYRRVSPNIRAEGVQATKNLVLCMK